MLELRDITVRAGSFSIENISLNINDTHCHIIVGPTGSGKTLLLETIAGLRRPDRGEILLDGMEIKELPPEKRGISYVPQDIAIFPHLSVEKNILYGVKKTRTLDSRGIDYVMELVEAVGIKHLLKRSTVNLSGGESQRVALVRALAPGYRFLLLDEPLSALHEGMKKELWFLLKELQQKYKLTMLMVTHNMEEAFFLGESISIMVNGRILQTGRKRDIYHMPGTIEVARFLGIRNLFNAEIVGIKDNKLSVYCNDLNTILTIPDHGRGSFRKGTRVLAGIRSEEVMILRPRYQKQKQDNLIYGTINEIHEKGASHTVLFVPENSPTTVQN